MEFVGASGWSEDNVDGEHDGRLVVGRVWVVHVSSPSVWSTPGVRCAGWGGALVGVPRVLAWVSVRGCFVCGGQTLSGRQVTAWWVVVTMRVVGRKWSVWWNRCRVCTYVTEMPGDIHQMVEIGCRVFGSGAGDPFVRGDLLAEERDERADRGVVEVVDAWG